MCGNFKEEDDTEASRFSLTHRHDFQNYYNENVEDGEKCREDISGFLVSQLSNQIALSLKSSVNSELQQFRNNSAKSSKGSINYELQQLRNDFARSSKSLHFNKHGISQKTHEKAIFWAFFR